MSENSYNFFENKECEYYPCHNDIECINCLFCYCPLYHLDHCLGDYKYIEVNGKEIKECTNCTYPHKKENYDNIMKILSKTTDDKPLTDLGKIIKIFDEKFIPYEITNNNTTIVIDDTHFYGSSCYYDQKLTIEFDDEQNFQHFMTSYKPYN